MVPLLTPALLVPPFSLPGVWGKSYLVIYLDAIPPGDLLGCGDHTATSVFVSSMLNTETSVNKHIGYEPVPA